MLAFTNRWRSVAYIAIGVLTLVLGQSADVHGCHGNGSGKRHSHGGTSGSSTSANYTGAGYTGWMGQPYGTMGGGYAGGTGQTYGTSYGHSGQGANNAGSQNSLNSQAVTNGLIASVNNPVTALAHSNDLNLAGKQVQLLEKMAAAGKQRAGLVLTTVQRKQLAQIVGLVR